MIKIVMDTNALISALGWKKGNERKVLDMCLSERILLVLSQPIVDELVDVLKRPKFDFIPSQRKGEFLKYLISISKFVYPKEKLDVVKEDPDDNKIVETAVSGKADYIISGDNHLLKLKNFRGIKIVNAGRFLELERL